MRAGDRATLLMDDSRAHIQIKVISLENGMAGKWIRVSSLDHKQTYFGQVINGSLLKGTF
jgi:flagella basal body P-ring formation protein FlgA